MGVRLAITSARPRATLSMPSVAMNGGSLKRAIRIPFARPHRPPITMPPRMPSGSGSPAFVTMLPNWRKLGDASEKKTMIRISAANASRRWTASLRTTPRPRVSVLAVVSISATSSGGWERWVASGRRGALGGERHDPLLAGLVGREDPGDPALAHHHDAVAHAQDLGQLGRDHDHGLALANEVVEEPVDLALGPDVDASCGLVEDQDVGVREQPLAHHDLLLVAAGQVAGALAQGRRLDREVADLLLRGLPRPAEVHGAQGAQEATHRRHHDVRLDVHAEREAVALPVLG